MFKKAIGAYNDGLNRNPNESSVLHNIGTLYYMLSENMELRKKTG